MGDGSAHDIFPPLEYARPRADDREMAMEIARPVTPKSERSLASYGALGLSLVATRGFCAARKCLRKEGHLGECWPKETNHAA